MSEQALTIAPVSNLQETLKLGEVLVKSGFFKDSRDASQAVVKVLAGQELGIGPVASMTGIAIVQGKPTIGANLIAAKVKGSGRYDYRVLENTAEACEIAYFQNGTEIGRSRFTMEEAKAAGLATKDVWKKYPRNMLFARAMSNGARWHCPDAFSGVTVYTPEEMGAKVDGEGDIIDVTPSQPQEPSSGPDYESVEGQDTEPDPKPQQQAGNGHQYNDKLDRAKAMMNAVNQKTTGYYNAIPHLLNAIQLEMDDQDWVWPELDEEEEWANAYQVAIAHTKKDAG